MVEKLKQCEGTLNNVTYCRQGGEADDEAEQDDKGRALSVECVEGALLCGSNTILALTSCINRGRVLNPKGLEYQFYRRAVWFG